MHINLTPDQYGQLIAALLIVVILFSAVLAMPMRVAMSILIVLIPFQPIETQYGSANVVLTYAALSALVLSGRRLYMPMLGFVLAILLTYLLSMSQTDKSTYMQHGIYVFLLCSSFAVFYLCYNFARDLKDARYAVNLLIVANVIALVICVLQVYSGITERFTLFGISELRLHRVRVDERVVGPFGAAGLTAEYFMLLIFVLAHDLMHAVGRRRLFVVALIAANLAGLLSTANRGAFLTMLGIFPLFLYTFRKELGSARIVQISVLAVVLLAGTSVALINYTNYGQMFARLDELTQNQGLIPETRQVTWPAAWENIKKRPFLGHGPRLRLMNDEETYYPGHVVIPYPHDLYLHLLFTVGIVGTLAFLAFFSRLGWQLWTSAHELHTFTYRAGLVRLAPLLLLAVLIDQIKIEFLRFTLVDYSHFLFCLFGLMLGFAHREATWQSERAPVSSPEKARASPPRVLVPVYSREGSPTGRGTSSDPAALRH